MSRAFAVHSSGFPSETLLETAIVRVNILFYWEACPSVVDRSRLHRLTCALRSRGPKRERFSSLQAGELVELLAHVKTKAPHPWIYPLFCFAAHTGARRSEIMRALVADVDFTSNTVLVREKKRSRSQRTARRVPLTPFLKGVLKDWLAIHPGGPALFCQAGGIARSKKRSRTTGHQSGKKRSTSLKGRMATVKKREQPSEAALTRNEVHDHFKRVLAVTKWEPMRGLHCLRHSFISACAIKGVDQRLVQEWAGHMNEATSKCYRHLYPSTQQEAIKGVFGS
jgi:integrase